MIIYYYYFERFGVVEIESEFVFVYVGRWCFVVFFYLVEFVVEIDDC